MSQSIQFEELSETDGVVDDIKYLLFRLGGELYGTPLLGVREVVEPQPCKPVPNTAPYFKGVINIRGQIAGLADLRVRFGYEAEANPQQALLLFETETGPMAALVDTVEAVVRIDEKDIETRPNIRVQVPLEFLVGIASFQGRLVTLIDLRRSLGSEDIVAIRQSKIVA